MIKNYKAIVDDYVTKVLTGKKLVGKEVVLACARYKADLKRKDLEFRNKEPDKVCAIIENMMVHQQGEDLDGTSLKN